MPTLVIGTTALMILMLSFEQIMPHLAARHSQSVATSTR
jgi:hypothetical protein